MNNKLKILTILLTATGLFLTSILLLVNWVQNYIPKPELLSTSISPEKEWKIRLLYINPGAMASVRYYVEVTDMKNKKLINEIDLDGSKSVGTKVYWTDSDTVVVWGKEVDVRKGSVLLATTTSPVTGRWNIKAYDVFPIGARYGHKYAEVKDLTGRKRLRKIKFDPVRIFYKYKDKDLNPSEIEKKMNEITWKNDNTVNIYGQVVKLD